MTLKIALFTSPRENVAVQFAEPLKTSGGSTIAVRGALVKRLKRSLVQPYRRANMTCRDLIVITSPDGRGCRYSLCDSAELPKVICVLC